MICLPLYIRAPYFCFRKEITSNEVIRKSFKNYIIIRCVRNGQVNAAGLNRKLELPVTISVPSQF